jgi:hypothetical protein
LTIQVNLKGAEPMRYKIVERDAFQVVGMKHEFSLLPVKLMEGFRGFRNFGRKQMRMEQSKH